MSIIQYPTIYNNGGATYNFGGSYHPGVDTTTDYSIEIDPLETVVIGDLIMINEQGKGYKGNAHSMSYGRALGIVSDIKGNKAYYERAGLIKNSNYNFNIGDKLYCRTQSDVNDINISTQFLASKTAAENMIIQVGYAISTNSFFYNLWEVVLL